MARATTIFGAQLRCPNCGAPMRWKGTAEVVECRYCRAHVAPATGATTEAPATARTQVRARTLVLVWAAMTGVVLLLSATALLVGGGAAGLGGGHAPEEVRALPLASTPQAIAGKIGGRQSRDNAVYATLRGMDFDAVDLVWQDASGDHVKGFTFMREKAHPQAKSLRERLRRYLRARMVEDKDGSQFHWHDANVSTNEPLTYLSVQVTTERSDWKQAAAELWKVAWAVVLDEPLEVSAEAGHAFLGWGHPLAALGKVDLAMTVDQARVDLPKRFGGAKLDKSSDFYATLAVEHPWFDTAMMHWENAKDGRFLRAYLRPPSPPGGLRDQKAVEQCVAKSFGKAVIEEADHLDGTWNADWTPPAGVRIHLSKDFLIFYADAAPQAAAATREWQRLLTALGGCGR